MKRILQVTPVLLLAIGGGLYLLVKSPGTRSPGGAAPTRLQQDTTEANEYTHPIDGFRLRVPENAHLDMAPIGLPCVVADGKPPCGVEVTLGGNRISFAVTPEWSFAKELWASAEGDAEWEETSLGGARVFRRESEDAELIEGEIRLRDKGKMYIIQYLAAERDSIQMSIQSFVPGSAASEELKRTYTSPTDAATKSDMKTIETLLHLAVQEGRLPKTDSMLRVTRNSVPPELAALTGNYVSKFPQPSKHYPGTFYGYRFLPPNGYEITAVLEDDRDPNCVAEAGLCIYRIRNGEVVSRK